jgi:hypothetical protein
LQKACIFKAAVECALGLAIHLKRHLPPDIALVDEYLDVNNQIVAFRLEGEGLPAWCRVGSDSPEIAMRVAIDLQEDGSVQFRPGDT